MPGDSTALTEELGEAEPFQVRVVEDDGGRVVTISCHGKESRTCRRALFVLSIDSAFRKAALALVQWKWFDRFILVCIVINSVLLAVQQHRAPPSNPVNKVCSVIDAILTWVFIMECGLKVLAMGLILDSKTYLRDPWNILDFVVVISAVVEMIPAIPLASFGFLRLFRVLRPLRSLNAVPEMKALVNTTISAVPKLSNVAALGLFIGLVFAIIGVTLMPGVFYRQCRATPMPVLTDGCWHWDFSDGAAGLCGGEYDCGDVGGYCFGHEVEQGDLKPRFPDGMLGPLQGGPPWCEGSAPFKLNPETDFVHFDHVFGALLLIFQCMTMEGWTDLMYYVQDAKNLYLAWVYFLVLIVTTSFFLLNVALAVVDEARDDFEAAEEAKAEEAARDDTETEKGGADQLRKPSATIEWPSEKPMWLDIPLTRKAKALADNDIFANFITLIITGNVVTMMMDTYPPIVSIQQPKDWVARFFLLIFIFEMIVELLARGLCGYLKNWSTAFDGIVLMVSIVEEAMYMTGGKAGGLKALRTLRLFRVLNKFASRSAALKILLKSMIETAKALRYWLVLFVLVLYIFTLMWMHFFNNQYHFKDPDALDQVDAWPGSTADDPIPWCPVEDGPFSRVRSNKLHHHQDCIPRAHFDNFGWGFVTIFQVMTGENWNTIMYAGMRAGGWGFGFFYIILLLFGQILFLSLFLSMLLSKFDEFKMDFEERHRESKAQLLARNSMRISKEFSASNSKDLSPLSPSRELSPQEAAAAKASTIEPLSPEIPGQMPKSAAISDAGSKAPVREASNEHAPLSDSDVEGLTQIPSQSTWPKDYSWFVLHRSNPIRRAALRFLEFRGRCCSKAEQQGETDSAGAGEPGMAWFDSFILACIIISTLGMMLDDPLADPSSLVIKVVREANTVFVYIFIFEMFVKLLAHPLFWGEGAYLHDGWNWLDGIVVLVSIITTLFPKGPAFLKTLRILRAFRPLRVIQRAKTLKMVVETIFKSMKELGVLLIVFLIFLLIFSLLFMMYLSGMLYQCEDTNIVFLKDVNQGNVEVEMVQFTMPLCLGSHVQNSSNERGSQARGYWNETQWIHEGVACPAEFPNMWQRASSDTPICIGRCDPYFDAGTQKVSPGYTTICPRRYNTPQELPRRCDSDAHAMTAEEQVGVDYVAAMQAWYTLPCAGSTLESAVAGTEPPMAALSCREAFCGTDIDPGRKESCKAECANPHPFFCAASCETDMNSPICKSCLEECQAACECSDFCTPLIKDAALCHEQGSNWVPMLSQNFNNVWNAMMTLTEISTTEGWVDVMYAASDTVDNFVQPVRDTNHPLWMVLFVFWIFLSFMFLMNLGVGVIVDRFMEEREKGRDYLLTPAQQQWIRCRSALVHLANGGQVFTLTNLHQLPPFRRKLFKLVTHRVFERSIISCIVLNTLLMAIEVYPELETPDKQLWRDCKEAINMFFAFVFTVEALLKLVAFRSSYWRDTWNRFDFGCVAATLLGIILQYSNSGINISSLASVIRIFRIARLFRLLKFKPLRPMNKLFTSLAVSLVKLANVGVVACLFLILFSILGVNLFAMSSQEEDTLNQHGNFKNFWTAFMTLFRAATGEAWNEIMHDLHKDEIDFFRQGKWCTPSDLFDWQDSYWTLKDKCLIDRPNACVATFWGWNPLPWMFWVGYTLFIGLVIMNIVVAVILEGYDESKSSDESAIIDTCKSLWERKYDPDRTLEIKGDQAIRFIIQALMQLQSDGLLGGDPINLPALKSTSYASQLAKIPMKLAHAFELPAVSEAGTLTFYVVVRQVFRLVTVIEHRDEASESIVQSLDECDQRKHKHFKNLRKLEKKTMGSARVDPFPLRAHIAAAKLQRKYRLRRTRRAKMAAERKASAGGAADVQEISCVSVSGESADGLRGMDDSGHPRGA